MMNEPANFPATAMPDRAWWSVLWPEPEKLLIKLGIGADMSVLDLCCGDGYFTGPLSKMVQGNVYALDLDAAMLDKAKEEVAACGGRVAAWLEGDAMAMATLLPEKVDYILIANTFHGVPDKPALVRCAAAALNPGGRFTIVNWHRIEREKTPVSGEPRGPKTEMRMTPDEVQALIEPAGFTLNEVVDLPPYHYGAVFSLRN